MGLQAVAEWILRGYRADDLDALYALDVVCFEPPFRFTRAATRRFAGAAKARVVLAEVGGRVVGFCIGHVEQDADGRVGYIVTLDVDQRWRGCGVARALMGAVEEQCVAAGCDAMGLHVFVGNAVAIRFYARCGYVRSAVEVGFYGVGLDAEVWSKRVGSAVPAL